MRLLVSVRNAVEAEAALAGGADIIDAKEPLNGPLGPVAPQTLQAIAAAVGGAAPVSVALGDTGRDDVSAELLTAADTDVAFIKIGFGGSGGRADWSLGLGAWSVRGPWSLLGPGSLVRRRPAVVGVAYADYEAADAPSPDRLIDVAAQMGAAGILLDTWDKAGSGLTALMTPLALKAFVSRARSGGLDVALAGRLTAGDVDLLCEAAPDILGFRGAACDGGRGGTVSSARVRELRRQIDRAISIAC
jgi:uncharacterized protein (UPF0264 family)